MKATLKIKILSIFITISFGVEFSTNKMETSFESPYLQYETIEGLLNFEEKSYSISNIWERNQFYRAVSNKIYEELSDIDFRLGAMEIRLRQFIVEYEDKLKKDHFQFSAVPPQFKYNYKPLPLDEKSIENDIYLKEALTLKSQYIQLYNYYKDSIDKYKDYLFTLREEQFYNDPYLGETVVFQDFEFEELFYANVQELLKESILFADKNQPQFLRVFRDVESKVISMNWFTNSDSLIKSKDFEYFQNGLLAAVREREGGQLKCETLYGQNRYSKPYYDFVFSAGFLPSNYDHYTEVWYDNHQNIHSQQYYTLNGKKIGSIEFYYDENGHLVTENWYKGEANMLIRQFSCDYQLGDGSYKIIEKDKFGRIVFQDIVSSLSEEKYKEGIR